MDTNSIADRMGEIQDSDIPLTYTPAPPGSNELHIQFLASQVEQLTAQVDQLRELNNILLEDSRSLRSALLAKDQQNPAGSPPVANPAAPSPANPLSKLKTKNPEVWSGTRSTLPRFLSSCRSKFMVETQNFPSELSKIVFAGSYLSDSPADWWHAIFQRYEEALQKGSEAPAELTSFTTFAQALSTAYGDPDLKGTMERSLYACRQSTSVSNYAAEFQRIAGHLTDWTDGPLMFHYKLHLKENIKNSLVHEKPYPTTLLEMITATIRLDNREFERILEKRAPDSKSTQSRPRQNNSTTSYSPYMSAAASSQPRATQAAPPVAQITAPPANDGSTPMEIDYVARKRLSEAEKEHRRVNKLCNYCGEPGHIVRNCPTVPVRRGINWVSQAPLGANFLTEIVESSDAGTTNAHAQE
jgi:Retrotransposon gag protein/Zinc knuckle